MTAFDLSMAAPDDAVENLQEVIRKVAKGGWKAAAKILFFVADCGTTPFHDDCSKLGHEFYKKA